MIGLIAIAACVLAAQVPATAEPRPAHVMTMRADLESPAASRTMVVLRGFVERHPGVALIEFHIAPPAGNVRAVDRAVLAAQAQNAGLGMAELILANPGRRSTDDFVAMARQLRLDESSFREALARDGVDSAAADDIAAAAAAKPPRPVTVAIDGEPLAAPPTLAELESRLVKR